MNCFSVYYCFNQNPFISSFIVCCFHLLVLSLWNVATKMWALQHLWLSPCSAAQNSTMPWESHFSMESQRLFSSVPIVFARGSVDGPRLHQKLACAKLCAPRTKSMNLSKPRRRLIPNLILNPTLTHKPSKLTLPPLPRLQQFDTVHFIKS